jgi:hypothetical protein
VITINTINRYDGSNDLASGECYNPMSNTWVNITPMGTRRSCLGIAGYDGLVRLSYFYFATLLRIFSDKNAGCAIGFWLQLKKFTVLEITRNVSTY